MAAASVRFFPEDAVAAGVGLSVGVEGWIVGGGVLVVVDCVIGGEGVEWRGGVARGGRGGGEGGGKMQRGNDATTPAQPPHRPPVPIATGTISRTNKQRGASASAVLRTLRLLFRTAVLERVGLRFGTP